MQRLKIAFLHDWGHPINEYIDTEDGLPAAIELISKFHQVSWFAQGNSLELSRGNARLILVPSERNLLERLDAEAPDVFICWGSLDRPWHKAIHERYKSIPKVLCFAGGPRDHIARSYFNVIVCESQCYIDDFTRVGVTAVRAFGTNTDVFEPRRLPKVWDAIYPASLCFHKNLELFAKSIGSRGLCVGNHNEPTIASKVLSLGTSLMHRVSSRTLSDLYNMSNCTVITCGPEGGAQRVVLESMACGVPVVVMSDHDRCVEFVKESGFGKVVHPVDIEIREAVGELMLNPMDKNIGVDYVKSKWTQNHYADSIMSAVNKVMLN